MNLTPRFYLIFWRDNLLPRNSILVSASYILHTYRNYRTLMDLNPRVSAIAASAFTNWTKSIPYIVSFIWLLRIVSNFRHIRRVHRRGDDSIERLLRADSVGGQKAMRQVFNPVVRSTERHLRSHFFTKALILRLIEQGKDS